MAEEKKDKKPSMFVIDGREYPVPAIETLNMEEAMVVHEYSGLTIDEIDEATGLHPGLVAGFMHVAHQRGNPDLKKTAVEKIIKGSNMVDAVRQFAADDDEEEDSPEATQNEPETPSSPESSPSSETSSTHSSEPDSVVAPEPSDPKTTGTPPSDTQPTSDQPTSDT